MRILSRWIPYPIEIADLVGGFIPTGQLGSGTADSRALLLGNGTWTKRACVSLMFTPTALQAFDDITVTFASDCLGGDPAFASAPTFNGAVEFIRNTNNANEMPSQSWCKTRSNTGCVIRVLYPIAQPVAPTAFRVEFTCSEG